MKNSIKQKFIVYALFIFCLIVTVLPTYADTNAVLSGVEVSQAASGKFQITLNADKEASFSKHIINENNIIIDLKDISEAENVNTVYKNTAAIDHVIVQPTGSSDLRILIQGQNVSMSDVSFASSVDGLNLNNLKGAPANSEIQLDRPVSSYSPVQQQDEEVLDTHSLSGLLGGLSLKNIDKKSNIGWLIAAITLIVTGFATLKLLNNQEKDDIKIDLSQGVKEREIDLFEQLSTREGLIAKSISNTKPSKSLAQKQGVVSASGYGLREYRNSQVDPNYRKLSRPLPKAPAAKKPQTAQRSTTTKVRNSNVALKQAPRTTQRMPMQEIDAAKGNIDSMKFLEAMTKIYEKSGRVDLAHGLRNNLMKAKTVQQRI